MDTAVMAAGFGGVVFGVGAAVIFLNSRFATERSAKIAAEAALKPLQRRELIAVDVAHDDLRGRAVILTSEGSELLQQAIPLWKAAQSRIASLVGGEESASLMRHKLAAIV